eukprot:5102763-Lingulodinium_polyedra.AAC.1
MGLPRSASVHRRISRAGTTWVFSAREQRPSSTHTSCPHSTPVTARPRTSMRCAGRPEQVHSTGVLRTWTGKRARS